MFWWLNGYEIQSWGLLEGNWSLFVDRNVRFEDPDISLMACGCTYPAIASNEWWARWK